MKYIELKQSLKNKIENAYLITGDDRYLCFDALKKIESSINISIKDMNSVTISGDSVSAKDIVDSANIYPFGDQYRLIIVKGFSPSKNKDEFKKIETYLKKPLSSTVLVFFNPDETDFFKGMEGLILVDCSKISAKVISVYVKNELAKNGIASNDTAIDTLILYSNNDMTKVTNELEKLICYVNDGKVLTENIVKEFVVQEKEFQVYQLSELLAKGDAKNAIDLVNTFEIKSSSSFQIITTLYNNYRRALFASLNKDKTNAELAGLFGVKEFAIKMMKNQIEVFNSKQLKKIVDMIAKFDKKIKIGEIKENVAIKTIIFNILEIRG